MEPNTKASGWMISSMATGLKSGSTVVDMKEIMIWAKRVARASMCGGTAATMMAIGLTIRSQGLASMSGQTAASTKANG